MTYVASIAALGRPAAMATVDVVQDEVMHALATDLTVDLTTTGCRSGRPHRIEIWMLAIDGRFFITGTPGPRDWFANLLADPACIVHLKQRVKADVEAVATVVRDPALRRHVLFHDAAIWYRNQGDELDFLLAEAPMVELAFTTSAS